MFETVFTSTEDSVSTGGASWQPAEPHSGLLDGSGWADTSAANTTCIVGAKGSTGQPVFKGCHLTPDICQVPGVNITQLMDWPLRLLLRAVTLKPYCMEVWSGDGIRSLGGSVNVQSIGLRAHWQGLSPPAPRAPAGSGPRARRSCARASEWPPCSSGAMLLSV